MLYSIQLISVQPAVFSAPKYFPNNTRAQTFFGSIVKLIEDPSWLFTGTFWKSVSFGKYFRISLGPVDVSSRTALSTLIGDYGFFMFL